MLLQRAEQVLSPRGAVEVQCALVKQIHCCLAFLLVVVWSKLDRKPCAVLQLFEEVVELAFWQQEVTNARIASQNGGQKNMIVPRKRTRTCRNGFTLLRKWQGSAPTRPRVSRNDSKQTSQTTDDLKPDGGILMY